MLVETIGPFLVVVGVVIASVNGCSASLDTRLDRKECGPHGECLRGWTCSEDRICVRASRGQTSQQARPDAGTAAFDAGGPDDAGEPISCEAGLACGGACVDSTRDLENCGACGVRCASSNAAAAVCRAGLCELTCDPGFTQCKDGCHRLSDEVQHCGSCDQRCPPLAGGTVKCAAGKCQRSCPAGLTECGGVCVKLESDPGHCGACGHACEKIAGGTSVCNNGACAAECDEKLTECSGACIDPQSDPSNCGACGTVCTSDVHRSVPICKEGTCDTACQPPNVACEKECVPEELAKMANLFTNCTTLAGRQDRSECQGVGSNLTSCDGMCVDTSTDEKNCGWCGRVCSFSSCINGVCWGL